MLIKKVKNEEAAKEVAHEVLQVASKALL